MPNLRHIDPVADAESVLTAFATGDEDLVRQAPPIRDLEQARTYLEMIEAIGWVIEHNGTFAGIVLASNRDATHRSAWMSYWITPGHRGRGLAAWGLLAASEMLFTQGLYRLELGARVNNPASITSAERAGYVHEGVSREELEYDGVRYDTVRMALLASDPRPSL